MKDIPDEIFDELTKRELVSLISSNNGTSKEDHEWRRVNLEKYGKREEKKLAQLMEERKSLVNKIREIDKAISMLYCEIPIPSSREHHKRSILRIVFDQDDELASMVVSDF